MVQQLQRIKCRQWIPFEQCFTDRGLVTFLTDLKKCQQPMKMSQKKLFFLIQVGWAKIRL